MSFKEKKGEEGKREKKKERSVRRKLIVLMHLLMVIDIKQ